MGVIFPFSLTDLAINRDIYHTVVQFTVTMNKSSPGINGDTLSNRTRSILKYTKTNNDKHANFKYFMLLIKILQNFIFAIVEVVF